MNIETLYSNERELSRDEDQIWFRSECDRRSLDLHQDYYEVLIGAALWLANSCHAEILTLGIAGGQGSGKSTFSELLLSAVQHIADKKGVVLSLDDFYLTHEERKNLAVSIHPLLATRGVPGTHDIDLMEHVVNGIRDGESVQVPVFNKAEDDRNGFREIDGGEIDFVILEGWCWGAKPTNKRDLFDPINVLEADEDAACVWRNYVNEQLGIYQRVFDTNLAIFLAVPGIDAVLKWRWLQEQGLPDGSRKMSKSNVERFIQYYERITLRMLDESPLRSDITIQLDHQHQFSSAIIKD